MRFRFLPVLGAAALGACALIPRTALAHAFGQRYDLPLPLSFYVVGAGATVAFSFVVMAFFLRDRKAATRFRQWSPATHSKLWNGLGRALKVLLQTLSVALFLLVLLSGFFGDQNPTKNFAPTFVWVLWWVGLAYVQALIGDLWAIANPWKVLHEWAERLLTARGGRSGGALLAYPAWLGHWPAVLFFFIFSWMELVSEAAERPASLATIILAYSLITWVGMTLFGRPAWLGRAEAFSVVFGFLARFAPLDLSGAASVREDAGRPFSWSF